MVVNGNETFNRTGALDPNHVHRSITTIKPFENLTNVTKKSITHLLLSNNKIQDSDTLINSTYLSDFENLTYLDLYGNRFTTLKGLENLNKLKFLRANDNNLGANDSKENKNETKDALASLSNKKELFYLDLGINPNLKWIEYLANDTAIRYLYLDGCDKNMNGISIIDIIKLCGSNYALSCKLLTASIYKASDYYTMSSVTYEDLYSDLHDNTYITHLSLNNCTTLNNEQLNTILSSMTSLQYLSLQNCTKLTTIDFVNQGKVTGLIEIVLNGTGVTDLTNLNEYAKNLQTLTISNTAIQLNTIVPTINRLGGNSYWSGLNYAGLVVKDISFIRQFPNLIGVTSIKMAMNGYVISGRENEIIDLSNLTTLNQFHMSGIGVVLKLPSSLSVVNISHSLPPIFSANTNKITNISVDNIYLVCKDQTKWANFFNSLANCSSLNQLTFNGECGLSLIDSSSVVPLANISKIIIRKPWSQNYFYNR